MAAIFTPKTTNEIIRITYDFSNAITDITETLTSAVWNVTTLIGVDANPNAMLNLPITLNNASTSRLISGGVSGNTYKIDVIVTTSANQSFELSGTIKIS